MSLELKFDERGLIPAILQNSATGEILMVAWMNKETLNLTRETGEAHFWSRSREKIWKKGEESGNVQRVEEILYDCDGDVLLLKVDPAGPACHTGEDSCFFRKLESGEDVLENRKPEADNVLERLYQILQDRKSGGDSEKSYVASLYQKGSSAYLKKIGEEATEFVIGCKNDDREEIIYEAADLWFHTMVAMAAHDVSPADILSELGKRFKP